LILVFSTAAFVLYISQALLGSQRSENFNISISITSIDCNSCLGFSDHSVHTKNNFDATTMMLTDNSYKSLGFLRKIEDNLLTKPIVVVFLVTTYAVW
jgi:hypothetical protein